jgi:hypothetical protein
MYDLSDFALRSKGHIPLQRLSRDKLSRACRRLVSGLSATSSRRLELVLDFQPSNRGNRHGQTISTCQDGLSVRRACLELSRFARWKWNLATHTTRQTFIGLSLSLNQKMCLRMTSSDDIEGFDLTYATAVRIIYVTFVVVNRLTVFENYCFFS